MIVTKISGTLRISGCVSCIIDGFFTTTKNIKNPSLVRFVEQYAAGPKYR